MLFVLPLTGRVTIVVFEHAVNWFPANGLEVQSLLSSQIRVHAFVSVAHR